MLRKIRIALASIFFIGITLLFLDFTGIAHTWLGWMAKIQFLPTVLAVNLGVVLILVLLTLILGRVYCSVICPLGVFQDIVSWISGKRKKHRYRFSFSPEKKWLRIAVFAVFLISLLAGVSAVFTLLAPYSAYGRIASNLFAPLYRWGNNVFAYFAERADSYSFYSVDVWIKSLTTFIVAAVTFAIISFLAWKNGRTYCNTICPVGTLLGYLSKYSIFCIKIDSTKCNKCGLCSRKCKAACINGKIHKVDYTRCVMCMDCIDTCKHGAIKYVLRYGSKKETTENKADSNENNVTDESRRQFIVSTAVLTASVALSSQEKAVDGGLAAITEKEKPVRATRITPPGSMSLRHFSQHCTACQLCISACPNDVLRPSTDLKTFMQPELSYDRGYCRPECNRCSQVCPAGAITPIDIAEKSSTQIGHAEWIRKNCIAVNGTECGNCARHCPAGAILMVPLNPDDENSPKIPAINTERCIGCGACEYHCPARPFSAIYVEGHERHRTI
ncbi:MAG: 4Fe-4S binding protein [Muribaculaceae bacterium]